MRAPRFQTALSSLLRPSGTTIRPFQTRWTHKSTSSPEIPSPIPFVPDVQTFLTLIGRGLGQHATKFPTWEALFTLTSNQLKELGIEPPRTRKYLMRWRDRYRLGKFGVGGDLKHVENGVAELKIEEGPVDPRGHQAKHVVNVPLGKDVEEVPAEERIKVQGYHVRHGHNVAGPYALPLKGGKAARVAVTEGMWEDRRGHKVDGGERRRAEVRFKRNAAERRAQREKMGFY
ncbi:hypothetical protein NKR23_g7115 [Pleurostoma richardsiae]|uniref:Small ribosomal subunit protein mS41 n=1 Tax=Pleurostoma richardsiae TaxID=41990 RepID=A0AA38RMT0_9PEZI|nr:hypothetical protein NKR23_g7115 [Pleurostoma richardsiae]